MENREQDGRRRQISADEVEMLFESPYIRVADLKYAPGKHYYDATRRSAGELVALKTDEEFKNLQPDAVSCIVVLDMPGKEPRLLLSREYRYPVGRFMLSVPAGLIDEEDRVMGGEKAILAAAVREIREETGLLAGDNDILKVANPVLFSTPGMTDESNAMVCAVLHPENLDGLSQEGAVGSELFDGFVLLTRDMAMDILKSSRDPEGNFYPLHTWAALLYFVSGLWNGPVEGGYNDSTEKK